MAVSKEGDHPLSIENIANRIAYKRRNKTQEDLLRDLSEKNCCESLFYCFKQWLIKFAQPLKSETVMVENRDHYINHLDELTKDKIFIVVHMENHEDGDVVIYLPDLEKWKLPEGLDKETGKEINKKAREKIMIFLQNNLK